MRTFFISDIHFGHKKIIEYENRPFNSIDEMDAEIIKRWNNVVSKNDTVWFLGDLCLGKSKEEMRKIVSQLNGHKKMILGNHDNWSIQTYYDLGFEFVSRYPVVLKNFFVLSHHPMEYMGRTSPFFYIYGHVHNSPSYITHSVNSQCVCVERQDYKPVEIEEFNQYQD